MKYKNITTFWAIIVSLIVVFMLGTSAISESANKIVKGKLEGYDNRSVNVQGWHYFLCPLNDESEEDKGLYIYDPHGTEVEYGAIEHALEVKIHITRNNTSNSCVKKIEILKIAD